MSEGRRAGLNLKDSLSLLFSAAALGVSGISYYTANVRVLDAVSARITDIRMEPGDDGDSGEGYRKGFVVLKVAFINTGNRQAIVDLPVYQLSDRPDLENGGFGGDVDMPPDTFPFILSPKEIRLIPLRVPVSAMLRNFESGLPVRSDQPSDPPRRRFFLGFRYPAIDSEGRPHASWSGMQVEIDVSAKAWEGLRPTADARKGDAYPSTGLFQKTR